jgi:hypothetical protein
LGRGIAGGERRKGFEEGELLVTAADCRFEFFGVDMGKGGC